MIESFDLDHAIEINVKRIEWISESLKKIGIQDLSGKTVLETGVGARGDFTTFLESLCPSKLVLIEAREENIKEHVRRYPHREKLFHQIDMNSLNFLEQTGIECYDIIVCMGTLYHLSNPEAALAEMATHCKVLLLETQIFSTSTNYEYVQDTTQWMFCKEDTGTFNQSYDGIGCRPIKGFLEKTLKKYFQSVDTINQPDHSDFHNKLRCAFICCK